MADKVLLDTHILLWLNGIDSKLTTQQAKEIESCIKHVSMASYWEISIKMRIGKLNIGMPIEKFIKQNQKRGIKTINVKPLHLEQLSLLPKFKKHNDPFDHLIISTSLAEKLSLVTLDNDVLQYLK